MSNNSWFDTSDFSGLTFDENNALENTNFVPAYNFDEFEPLDFDLSIPTFPDFELPDFGIDNPIFEYEPPKFDFEEPIFEYEPLDFDLESFDPLVLFQEDSSILEPSDTLPILAVNNRPSFKNVSVTRNGKGSSENDSLIGNSSANVIEGLEGNDILTGADGNDRLIGGKGNDLLTGGAGDDRLIGVNPYDSLAGRDEYDGLIGGSGKDAFILGDRSGAYYTGDGSATIWDFNALMGDSIQLTGSKSEYSFESNNLGSTNIFRDTDLIAIVYNTDSISSTSLDFV